MEDIDKLNMLLHYMKGFEPFTKTYKNLIRNNKEWCPFMHGEKINYDCYRANPSVNSLLSWIEKYIICCKFLDVNRYSVDEMTGILERLRNPEAMVHYEEFQSSIGSLQGNITFTRTRSLQ